MFPTSEMGDYLRRYAAVENVFSLYRVVDYTTHEVYNVVGEEWSSPRDTATTLPARAGSVPQLHFQAPCIQRQRVLR